MFLVNFLNGNTSPNWASLFLRGERFHSSDHSFLTDRLKACLRAEALLGRGVLRRGGRMADALEQPLEAFLAKWLAFLLPVTSLWLEIHLMVRLQFERAIADLSAWIRYWPGDELFFLRASITD